MTSNWEAEMNKGKANIAKHTLILRFGRFHRQ